jgi:hypothetical protein
MVVALSLPSTSQAEGRGFEPHRPLSEWAYGGGEAARDRRLDPPLPCEAMRLQNELRATWKVLAARPGHVSVLELAVAW